MITYVNRECNAKFLCIWVCVCDFARLAVEKLRSYCLLVVALWALGRNGPFHKRACFARARVDIECSVHIVKYDVVASGVTGAAHVDMYAIFVCVHTASVIVRTIVPNIQARGYDNMQLIIFISNRLLPHREFPLSFKLHAHIATLHEYTTLGQWNVLCCERNYTEGMHQHEKKQWQTFCQSTHEQYDCQT